MQSLYEVLGETRLLRGEVGRTAHVLETEGSRPFCRPPTILPSIMQRNMPLACSTSSRTTPIPPSSTTIQHRQFPQHQPSERGASTLCCASSGRLFDAPAGKAAAGERLAAGKGFGKAAAPAKARKEESLPAWEVDKKKCPCGSGADYQVRVVGWVVQCSREVAGGPGR